MFKDRIQCFFADPHGLVRAFVSFKVTFADPIINRAFCDPEMIGNFLRGIGGLVFHFPNIT